MAKQAEEGLKKSRKQWYSIIAPPLFNYAELGQTLANETSELIGKVLTTSMSSLTGDMKRQYIRLIFKVRSVKEGKGQTELMGYEISPAHVRRLNRKSGEKVEESFIIISKEGRKFRIKPIILTRHRIQRSDGSALRKKAKEFAVENLKDRTVDEIFIAVTKYDLQKALKMELNKVFPVFSCEIKKLELL